MEENGDKLKIEADEKLLRKSIEYQRIANRAVHKAQEENRSLGVPNWYSINGLIVSDIELEAKNKSQK